MKQVTEDVAARLAELDRLRIMDSPPDPVLDDLVRTAALVVDAPISLISLMDDHRHRFKASFGLPRGQSGLDVAFCSRLLEPRDAFIVNDAKNDPEFKNNPFVTGEPHIRFYAGVPLISSNNVRFGTLCIIDQVAHPVVDQTHLMLLKKLARLAVLEIEHRYPRKDE
jgi:GAF domain-containing protein